MSNLKFNPRNLILLLIILVITLFRLLVTFNSDELQFANFSSIGAVALFGGAYFKDHAKAFAFPLVSLFLSDFILASTIFSKYSNGFLYEGWYWTYLAFALMVLVGRVLLKKINVVSLLSSTLAIVFIHWIVTDFGVWFQNPSYPQTLAGYWSCLVKAIPFEIRFLEGTLIYGAIIFGAFEIMKSKYPVLKMQKQNI
ncbi:hypothetical protein ASE92_05415 [Pedobacter sp. Leaf41]|jgi:hypothetical protein|uniref:DUF6580 family putative transport protein n=1 Tax=Pedobacter sp. Leaf41 TaxID=1736218 RepID=UPI00070305F8|nr:DUF6580 family putative transport protein [Pedobacter sp. Leaf41]KQN38861.1 hypothetical protein ASE92_05415 [Pedobacter sp. Leaf41]RZL30740.1 MAG: hypothetical protein EOO96_17540 [Pedobacter sp.]